MEYKTSQANNRKKKSEFERRDAQERKKNR